MLTKAINIGVLLLAFSRPIRLVIEGNSQFIVKEASMGLTEGSFNKEDALRFYGPMISAYVLKKAISMLRKTVRV